MATILRTLDLHQPRTLAAVAAHTGLPEADAAELLALAPPAWLLKPAGRWAMRREARR